MLRAVILLLALAASKAQAECALDPARLVAHAGGAIEGRAYSNSRNALDSNYAKGHRLFEIDLDWTSDGRLVLVHGWDSSFAEWYEGADRYDRKKSARPSLAEFKTLKMKHGLTQMTVEDLSSWLTDHRDAYAVTDVKSGSNVDALGQVAKTLGKMNAQVIPQIYGFEEFEPVKRLGFDHIILTLYQTGATKEELLAFSGLKGLFAVTMTEGRALANALALELRKNGVFVYVHTINDAARWDALHRQGVSGLYTDALIYSDLGK